MDRFKFRVSLKLETKSILLYSNNVNFDNREMILSGKDFKKQIESYNLTPKDYEFLYAYVYEEDVDYNPNYFVEFDDIEQSTGLKDKNDKLIYEGDILKSIFSDEKLYEVIWCADCYKLRVFTKSSKKTLEYLELKNTRNSYEVIDNIHEGVNNENK